MADAFFKRAIESALSATSAGPLAAPARALLGTLGYRSDKRLDLDPNSAAGFQAQFDPQGRLNAAKALLADWRSVDLLQQITADELGPALSGQGQLFESRAVDGSNIQSYLFFAVDLSGDRYTRTQLAAATREINKLFPMPALVLFRHGDSLTFAIIARRVHKRDASRDVLEKVTLIKEIRCASPHRAHVEILADLALPSLAARHSLANFVDLQRAWEKTLDTSELNKKFFREVANWYFWAVQSVVFPDGAGANPETRNAVSVIRLITRLIFVWFIREKGLVPAELFDPRALQPLLRWNDPKGSSYYKAILQNLFFATLNSEMGDARRFRGKNPAGRDSHFGIASVYRYEDYFTDPAAALRLFASIPFLNGGLFECLDRPADGVRIDGFSDRADNPLVVPDFLFFGDEQDVDLNAVFGTRNRRYQARGLLRIFDSYKFTIEENTPLEEEIALDPELLGKVFENLLAAYNPETGATARKQTGSFYTPREIVDYMVDESLLAWLETALTPSPSPGTGEGEKLRELLAYSDQPHGFDAAETAALIAAIDRLKCLDPACGSGAFPMGMLHKLVYLLARLDPDNSQWRALQRQKAVRETEEAYTIGDRAERKARLDDIEEAFTNNTSDYGRKLYLIENCIYGVDIQPIAVQIAKLRFFISLVVDQTVDDGRPNRGVRPLPNLETRFVAANTLIGIPRPQQMAFRNPAIEQKERELAEVRRRHFAARTQATKEKYRREDQRLRGELAGLLRQDGWGRDTAAQLAAWDPYDQNAHADFFDPEWMFGVAEGFDVVIGNPPYIFITAIPEETRRIYIARYATAIYRFDVYGLFLELTVEKLMRTGGAMSFIIPHTLLSNDSFEKLRRLLLSKTTLRSVVDIGPSVFAGASNETMVLVCVNSPAKESDFVAVLSTSATTFPEPTAQFRMHQRTWEANPRSSWLVSGSQAVLLLLVTMERAKWRLGQLCTINQGLRTGDNTRFLSEVQLSGKWKRAAGGKKIGRYQPISDNLFVFYEPSLLNAPRGSDIFESNEKIVIQEIRNIALPDRLVATYDNKQTYCLQSTNVINLRPQYNNIAIKYLLGIINSRLANFYFHSRFPGNNHIPSNQLAQIPIPHASDEQQRMIEAIVNDILAAKAANLAADVSALEAEIDQRVYALYGLTAEEIRIVEGET